MHGPRLLLLAAPVALAAPSARFTVGAFWLYQAYDAFVQGDATIVTAQMKGGAVDIIRADVNPPK